MNNISETQRLAEAVAVQAAAFTEKLRSVREIREEQTADGRAGAECPNRYTPIPPNGKRCEVTGLGHAKHYGMLSANGLARGKVRVASVRTPGANRGKTLFHVGDMLWFLDELASK